MGWDRGYVYPQTHYTSQIGSTESVEAFVCESNLLQLHTTARPGMVVHISPMFHHTHKIQNAEKGRNKPTESQPGPLSFM